MAEVARPLKARPLKARVARRVNPEPAGAPRTGRVRQTIQLEGKMAELYRGMRSVADMDNDELARMQFKDSGGKFRGRPNANIPTQLAAIMRKELIDRVSETRRGALQDANKLLVDVIKDPNAKDADRIKAALALIEREEGKVPDKVELSTGDTPFEVALGMARVVRGPRPQED